MKSTYSSAGVSISEGDSCKSISLWLNHIQKNNERMVISGLFKFGKLSDPALLPAPMVLVLS
jgi:hypothetical protein